MIEIQWAGTIKRRDVIDAPYRQSKRRNRGFVNTLNHWNHVLGGGASAGSGAAEGCGTML